MLFLSDLMFPRSRCSLSRSRLARCQSPLARSRSSLALSRSRLARSASSRAWSACLSLRAFSQRRYSPVRGSRWQLDRGQLGGAVRQLAVLTRPARSAQPERRMPWSCGLLVAVERTEENVRKANESDESLGEKHFGLSRTVKCSRECVVDVLKTAESRLLLWSSAGRPPRRTLGSINQSRPDFV